MKINKKVLTEAILESDNEVKNEEKELTDVELTQSKADIADQIQDNIEVATDGEVTLTDKEAVETAEIAKEAGKDLNVDEIVITPTEDSPLGVKNKLTEILDDAFAAAKYFKQENIKEVANVLVCGLPGSGKTASVYDWARGKVNITYINAKNNDLDAFINGYTVQDPKDGLIVTQAVSNNLASLDRPRSVLFIDEYNRQTKDQIRASLLTLINEHYVVGREEGGRHYFKNFLFTIAAINPASFTDKGASPLNDAEKSRFLYTIDNFDSDTESTVSYLDAQYSKLADRLAKMKDIDKEDVWAEQTYELPEIKEIPEEKMTKFERIEALLRIQHLGKFLVQDYRFSYDDKSKLDDLYREGKKMLNQRAITSGLAAARGDVDVMKRWVKNASGFLDEDIQIILDILDSYTVPTTEELFKKAGIKYEPADSSENPVNDDQGQAPQADDDSPETESDESLDDDEDFFVGKKAGASNIKILSAAEASTLIKNALNTL